MADPDLHLAGLDLEVRMPHRGRVQGPSPTPTERQLSMAFCAAARTSSAEAPVAALAPPTFHIRISPATPGASRARPAARDHVVVGDHGEDLDPLLGDHPLRHLHVHVVAGIVAVEHDDPLPPFAP
jgi:hypothetical protein